MGRVTLRFVNGGVVKLRTGPFEVVCVGVELPAEVLLSLSPDSDFLSTSVLQTTSSSIISFCLKAKVEVIVAKISLPAAS